MSRSEQHTENKRNVLRIKNAAFYNYSAVFFFSVLWSCAQKEKNEQKEKNTTKKKKKKPAGLIYWPNMMWIRRKKANQKRNKTLCSRPSLYVRRSTIFFVYCSWMTAFIQSIWNQRAGGRQRKGPNDNTVHKRERTDKNALRLSEFSKTSVAFSFDKKSMH